MSVDTYIAKRAEFSRIKDRIAHVVHTLSLVASALRDDPAKFIFSNQPIGLPMEATMSSRGRSADANEWPSVEHIMQLLQEYHRVRDELHSAWQALNPDQQASVKAPGDLLPR
jgi:hypothetical protein